MATKWTEIPHDHYWDALGALPPALRLGGGFLIGEPHSARRCSISGDFAETYRAYREAGERYYAAEPMTAAEFRNALTMPLKVEA